MKEGHRGGEVVEVEPFPLFGHPVHASQDQLFLQPTGPIHCQLQVHVHGVPAVCQLGARPCLMGLI